MIVQLTGSIIDLQPGVVVLDVGGVGYEMRCSSITCAALSQKDAAKVSIYTRMCVRETALSLFVFFFRSERALFDRLIAISGIGPAVALSILSTFTPEAFASVVQAQDAPRMATVPGVGKKTANRILVEMQSVFSSDTQLRSLVGTLDASSGAQAGPVQVSDMQNDVKTALLSMGFTSEEIRLALEGYTQDESSTPEHMLSYALHRLGGKA